jgi:hypothetical protein
LQEGEDLQPCESPISTAFAFISCAFSGMKFIDADVSSYLPTICIVRQNKISQRVALQAWINEFHYDNSGGDRDEVCINFCHGESL